MTFLHLFIINKSGGLIYHRELSKYAPVIDVNILLSIGSTFHSLCSIAVEACPVKKQGAVGGSRRASIGSASVSGTTSGTGGGGVGGNGNNAGTSASGVKLEDGIEIIEGGGIILCCYQTLTGVKFVIT